MSNTTLNRDDLLAQTLREDERSDLKQHADKMLRDFEKFNNFSSNRAIWELVQNACDLSVNSEITIDYRNDQIAFTHNGKPFETKSLISLIKQVSGKYGDQEDIPEVGKYGTGFLTTHSFGRKFTINSVLSTGEFYLPINDFLIDRSPKTWELLSDNISIQKKRVYEIIQNESPIDITDIKTTFTYAPETDTEKEYVRISFIDLNDYIPLVFTVNSRLNKITVFSNDGLENVYSRIDKKRIENTKDINLFKTTIATKTGEKWIYSLIDEETSIEIILPIDKDHNVFEFSDRIARLFLYYPLVGSEDFGINFLINCNNFLPNEPRSGVHLKSNKDQVKEQEAANRLIIEKCTVTIFNFLKSNVIEVSNPLFYANVRFNTNTEDSLLNEYFNTLQEIWNVGLSSLPFVKTALGYQPIKDVVFLNEELIVDSDADLKTIHQMASRYYDNIPVIEDILKWSNYALNWNDTSVDFVGHNDILAKISEGNLSQFNKDELIAYYEYLLSIGKANVFSELALLPSINGNFHKLGHLLEAKDLDSQLLKFGQDLIPQALEQLIHQDFRFTFDLSPFNRRDYSNRLKLQLEEGDFLSKIYLSDLLAKDNYHQELLYKKDTVSEDFFTSIISFCKLTANITSSSKPNQLVKLISNYYGLDDALLYLQSIDEEIEDLDNRVIRKTLVQMFFNLLSMHTNTWVEDNLELLARICSLDEDSYKDVYKSSSIYPNQLFELHKIEKIKRDKDVWEDIKQTYLKVKGQDINEVLSVKEFNDFIPEDQYVNNKYLTVQIEEKFFEDVITEIEEHPFRDTIISIIPKLTKRPYQELFPQLDLKKANIMISVVTREETKNDIFAIVTLKEAQLKKLGLLVQNDNFEAILNKAIIVLQQEEEKRSDFRHKYEIGTNIERLIREKLSLELSNRVTFINDQALEASDIQGGQDIVVLLDDNPVYFVEVKSRWNSVSSVSMSKLQLQRAVEESSRYALCSVDISKYEGSNDRYNLPIEDVLPLTKIVKQIGAKIQPLIEDNLFAEKDLESSIHLIDYRGIIPQDIIKKGTEFSEFIDFLIAEINTLANSKAYA
jgi:hypothetical protein